MIWVQGLDDESVRGFTVFGVDSLADLIKIHRESRAVRTALKLARSQALPPTADGHEEAADDT